MSLSKRYFTFILCFCEFQRPHLPLDFLAINTFIYNMVFLFTGYWIHFVTANTNLSLITQIFQEHHLDLMTLKTELVTANKI
jgi:hypothetical protein